MVFTEKELLERREAYFSKYKVEEKRKKGVSSDPNNPLETEEQKHLVYRLSKNWYFYSALPLGNLLSKAQAYKNVAEGVNSWVPDLLILTKNNRILFIELKRLKKGVVSEEQKEWNKRLNNCHWWKIAFVCKGYLEAIKVIEEVEKLN